MIKLSKEQVLKLYVQLIEATGGTRDEKMLDSVLNSPFQSFNEKELYSSIQAKAAQFRPCVPLSSDGMDVEYYY